MQSPPISADRLAAIVTGIAEEMADEADRGAVAGYIPELAGVNPGQFALALATADGAVIAAGDADVAFSIQSISKVFTLTLALKESASGCGSAWGASRRAMPFNSLVHLEYEERQTPQSVHQRGRPGGH